MMNQLFTHWGRAATLSLVASVTIVALLFLFFFSIGIAYGVGARKITSQRDVPKLMEGGLRGTLTFLTVALPAGLAGLLLQDWFEARFSDARAAAVGLLGTAWLLLAGDAARRRVASWALSSAAICCCLAVRSADIAPA